MFVSFREARPTNYCTEIGKQLFFFSLVPFELCREKTNKKNGHKFHYHYDMSIVGSIL